MRKVLENKNTVIYGAGGSIGDAVAGEFARDGARVFLAGRTPGKQEAVAGTAGRPETLSPETLAAVDSTFRDEAAFRGLIENLHQRRMTRCSPRLAEVAATAAFLASEKAGAITGTFVNVTSGTFPS
jgi:NAD(P)-dependent dehydrogenase (short-subunit alcohol dehydrogenase family)